MDWAHTIELHYKTFTQIDHTLRKTAGDMARHAMH